MQANNKQFTDASNHTDEFPPPPPPAATDQERAQDACTGKGKKRMRLGGEQETREDPLMFLDSDFRLPGSILENLELAAQNAASEFHAQNAESELAAQKFRREEYWQKHMKPAILACMLEPLFGFRSFRVDKDYWYESFISDQAWRLMCKEDRHQYKSKLKQSVVIELFATCGYAGEHGMIAAGEFKQFVWNAALGCKTAYRCASSKCPREEKHNSYMRDGRKCYHKIRCPNLLKEALDRLYFDAQKANVDKAGLRAQPWENNPEFSFFSQAIIEERIHDNRFFFPFEHLVYDQELFGGNLFAVDDCDSSYFSYKTSRNLSLTVNATNNIKLLHEWIVQGYLAKKIEICPPIVA